MAKAQFKKVFEEMWEKHKSEFQEFMIVHTNFVNNPKKYKKEFNLLGAKIIDIVKHYETVLCGRSESSGFGNYTSKLSEKFWGEVRKIFSEIDEVGVE